jgi:VanZ family protein
MIIKHLLAHKKKAVAVSLVYTMVLTYYSLKASPIPVKLPSQSDKLLHALAYFVFTVLWFLSFKFTFSWNRKKSVVSTFILAVSFGILIEILQEQLTNYRQADVLDVLANIIGTVLAIITLKLIFKDR